MPDISNASAYRRVLLMRAMIAIGKPMATAARPFYAALLHRTVLTTGAHALATVCDQIGVMELPYQAARLAAYMDAMSCGDEVTGRAIEEELKDAGCWDDAMTGLDGYIGFLGLAAPFSRLAGRANGGGNA